MSAVEIKALIVDDSVVYRSQIRSALEALSNVRIVGTAANGLLALKQMEQQKPDLVILDLEMPEMDGLTTLREIRKNNQQAKVLVFSSLSRRGAEITLDALRFGASDFVTKPGSEITLKEDAATSVLTPIEKIKALLKEKIEALFKVEESEKKISLKDSASIDKIPAFPPLIWDLFKPSIIVIGSSTGGPSLLEKIFSQIKKNISVPILITQHMPPVFTATLAERIQALSGIPTHEAAQGMKIENGHIYIAKGDYHLRIQKKDHGLYCQLDQDQQVHSVRPAVDHLFTTAAELFPKQCLGFVLTGMGYDGRDGAIQIKKSGGAMAIQSEDTCTVFGMPGAVKTAGAYDRIFSPDEIIKTINEKA